MAFNPKKIPVLDLFPNVAVGVSIPFNGPAVFKSTYTTQDQIKSNLINYFLTNKGERVFNPGFGGNLKAQVFEQLSLGTISNIETILKNDLSVYFPNVNVVKLEISGYEDNNQLDISLTYGVKELAINDQINITL